MPELRAGNLVRQTVREQVAAVGQDQGDRCLHQRIVGLSEDQRAAEAHHGTESQAAADHQQRAAEAAQEIEVSDRRDAQHGREEDQCGPVVEEALAADDRGEPARRADLAEDSQHGDRIGGGDDRAEEQRAGPGEAGERMQGHTHQAGGGDNPGQGQEGDQAERGPQLGQRERVGAMKQEDGEEHGEDHVVGQLDPRHAGGEGQGKADYHQRHLVGQADPPHRRSHQGDHDQQDDEGGDIGLVAGHRLLRPC